MNKFTKELFKSSYGNRLVIKLYQDNKYIGQSIAGFKYFNPEAILYNINIDKFYQVKGKGSNLLNYTEHSLFNYGIKNIQATIHQSPLEYTIDFYLKNGYLYHNSDLRYGNYLNGEGGTDLILMAKKINFLLIT